jgi:hypothetical protein
MGLSTATDNGARRDWLLGEVTVSEARGLATRKLHTFRGARSAARSGFGTLPRRLLFGVNQMKRKKPNEIKLQRQRVETAMSFANRPDAIKARQAAKELSLLVLVTLETRQRLQQHW